MSKIIPDDQTDADRLEQLADSREQAREELEATADEVEALFERVAKLENQIGFEGIPAELLDKAQSHLRAEAYDLRDEQATLEDAAAILRGDE
jgi:cell division protein FtsB